MTSRLRIFYIDQWKTFQLYPGENTQYTMAITPEGSITQIILFDEMQISTFFTILTSFWVGSLEHLYFGQRLHAGYDIRYLSQSSRLGPFETVESPLPPDSPHPVLENIEHISLDESSLTPSISLLSFNRIEGQLGKGTICMEYSDLGTGDFRTPSFIVAASDGSTLSPVRYLKHKIIPGRVQLPDYLPSVRVSDEDECTTLIVTLADQISGLEIDLIYGCLHDYNAVTRSVAFRNKSGKNMIIQRAFSSTIDFESSTAAFHLVQLSGSWARERQIIETKLTQGMQSFGSTRGVSSHQHNPFAAITIGPPSETEGRMLFSYSTTSLISVLKESQSLSFNLQVTYWDFRYCTVETF